jgi:thiamine transporter ThiT
MTIGLKLLTRIAIFSALVFVLSWTTLALPNVSLVFFVVFSAGFLWGLVPGLLVGIIGMGLVTAFNPYGAAPAFLMLAQMVGASFSGAVGALFRKTGWSRRRAATLSVWLIAAAVVCTILFYLPVNLVDAWLIQPFWPRFITSAGWALISMGSNIVIFPLLFGVTRYLHERESGVQWRNA